jgi:hypothetical protein
MWKNTLEELGITVKYSPIRHPESNPAERVMKELGKFFKIYCCQTHKKWPEFVSHIQNWLNQSVKLQGTNPLNYWKEELKGKSSKKSLRNYQTNHLRRICLLKF